MRSQRFFVVCLLLLISLPPIASSAQVDGSQSGGIGQPSPADEQRQKFEKEMLKRANQERQKQIKHDTEKLLKLAGELKDYVEKTNVDILSIDVVKKAEEIEKLAHSVKEKMKTSY